MIVGFDLDNTIICYDELFWRVARDQKLVPESTPKTKEAVKQHIFETSGEEWWTALQGVVYGDRLLEASPFPGALEVLKRQKDRGGFYIVSHKTKFPVIGAKTNLQEAAAKWLLHYGVVNAEEMKNVFFEVTRKEKVARIASLKCDVFVDDLFEVFEEAGFPSSVKKVLFGKAGEKNHELFALATSWAEIETAICK